MKHRILFGDVVEPKLPEEMLPPVDLVVPDSRAKKLRQMNFQVYIIQSIFREIHNHVTENLHVETGGILVGHAFRSLEMVNTKFVVIVGAIRQDSTDRGAGHYTVGPTEIAAARTEMEYQYPGLACVGWYHSHPGHGIFLSRQDMTIVRSIYNANWHVAMVIDPKRRQAGFFKGAEGEELPGWLELSGKPKSIEVVSVYNRAVEAKGNDRQRQIENFKLWFAKRTGHPELSHWAKLRKYQNIPLETSLPTTGYEDHQTLNAEEISKEVIMVHSTTEEALNVSDRNTEEEVAQTYSPQRTAGFSLRKLFEILFDDIEIISSEFKRNMEGDDKK